MDRVKANRWAVAAFMAATLGALVAAFAPTYSGCGSTPSGGETCGHATSFAVNGTWVLVVVSVPVMVAFVPVLVRRRPARVVSAVLLWIGCVVGMWSVGMFFVPAAILMTIAAQRLPAVASPIPPVPVS
jgi:hypothetical protein